MKSTLLVAAVGTLMLFAACGSSEPVADTSAPVVTDEINYAEGAFIPSGSGSTDGDAAADDEAASDAAPITDATDAATTTTAADPDTAASTSVPGGGSAGTSTSVPAGGAATTVAPSGSSTPLGTNEGIVRIGTVDYPFKAETCDVDELGFSVLGYGTSSSGQPVEVDMGADTVDLDGDGEMDINFDIYVTPNVDAGVDVSNLPDFYASKVETASFSEGDDIVVMVSGSKVSGSGPVEDLNEVAVPDGQTLPMTFEVRCA